MAISRREALKRHKARLNHLTDKQARNLMWHALNRTPLMPVSEFHHAYVDEHLRC